MDIKIACPKCEWEPDKNSAWQCTCGHQWNTFNTGGKCPSCGFVWKDTQCLRFSCLSWSPHIDWYKNLQSEMVKEAEKSFQNVQTEPKKL